MQNWSIAPAMLVASSWMAQVSAEEAGPSGPDPLQAKPERTIATAHQLTDVVMLKFVNDSAVRLVDGALSDAFGTPELARVGQVIARRGASVHRMFALPEQRLDELRALGEERSGIALHDLNLFFRLELPDEEGAALCDELNAFGLVEIAWLPGTLSDPTVAPVRIVSSPDFEGLQRYRLPAPAGVDADFGDRCSQSDGAGVVIADVETGWTDDHEDIAHQALGQFVGLTPAPYPWDHGTAVLGELVGEDDGSGVKGIVSGCDVLMSSHLGSASNIGTAILHAVDAVGPGDVVVLEVQCYQGPPSPHPCEYDSGIFATVQTATAVGIHVFAAAGNGNNNLDSSAYGGAFDRSVRDSGAVMVGASDGESLDRASFSNYGTRLDAHGWGYDVTTTGYGDLQGGPATQEYTESFSGTSSATPIVTGAGIMIDTILRNTYEQPSLSPRRLRQLISDTGTPQGSGGLIGPRPDVRAALRSMGHPELELVGPFVGGQPMTLNVHGKEGDPFGVLASLGLLAKPNALPPYGDLHLDSFDFVLFGVIPASGVDARNFVLPPTLSGHTIYLQALQVFKSSATPGRFTNYETMDVQ